MIKQHIYTDILILNSLNMQENTVANGLADRVTCRRIAR